MRRSVAFGTISAYLRGKKYNFDVAKREDDEKTRAASHENLYALITAQANAQQAEEDATRVSEPKYVVQLARESNALGEVTEMAEHAIVFADLFRHAFADGLRGRFPCDIQLTIPVGPSTGGGRHLQHIRLMAREEPAVFVLGSIHHNTRTVELRTYSHVAGIYAARYGGKEFPAGEASFGALLDRLHSFLATQGFNVRRVDAPLTEEAPPKPPMKLPSRSAMEIAGFVVVAVVLGSALAFVYIAVR